GRACGRPSAACAVCPLCTGVAHSTTKPRLPRRRWPCARSPQRALDLLVLWWPPTLPTKKKRAPACTPCAMGPSRGSAAVVISAGLGMQTAFSSTSLEPHGTVPTATPRWLAIGLVAVDLECAWSGCACLDAVPRRQC